MLLSCIFYSLDKRQFIFLTLSHAGHLTIDDFGDVQLLLWKIRYKWFQIGIAFSFDIDHLKSIGYNHRDNSDQCLPEVISEWLKRAEPKATWGALASALKEPPIDEEGVACDIADKYVIFVLSPMADYPSSRACALSLQVPPHPPHSEALRSFCCP